MTRYLFFGHLTIDDTVMPDGRTVMGTVGGNALYSAIGAHAWTDDLALAARCGKGYPPELIQELAASGYEVEGFVPCEYQSIWQWQLYDRIGGRQYVPIGASGNYDEMALRPEEIPQGLHSGAVACHIAPIPVERQRALVQWARERGLRVAVDPHHESVRGTASQWKSLLPLVDVFLPSREEATHLLEGWPGPQAAARAFAEWGAAVVCLKLGADGVYIWRAADQMEWRVPSIITNPVDTTGCGDAFCGGFLVGWCQTNDLLLAARYGTISASFVVEDFGARHAFQIDREEARRRLRMLAGVT
ncbi:MAG TPA: carbohydrate kinase family protein [Ktedonobacterales bacterium]|jgi:ribokinase